MTDWNSPEMLAKIKEYAERTQPRRVNKSGKLRRHWGSHEMQKARNGGDWPCYCPGCEDYYLDHVN